ncbi:hypothetical protein [Streptomyces sp. NPDC048192]|uniref:hypothetical protein n=1 Tax=Streptomyces sp. NPDC048192 TaxID=3365510 RepID=UPI003714543F
MGRRGNPRPGARLLGVGLALPALLGATACGRTAAPAHSTASGAGTTSAATPAPADSPGASASAAPMPTSPAALCTRLVAHWAREVLDSGTYGDYQSMGLSNGQYAILREVVDAARAVKQRQGTVAAERLIDRQAHAACAERYRHGTPSGGPWR